MNCNLCKNELQSPGRIIVTGNDTLIFICNYLYFVFILSLLCFVSGSLYTQQPLSDNIYETPMMAEGGMDTIDDVLMSHQGASSGPGGAQGSLINPIDKLYSMQNSYFSTE